MLKIDNLTVEVDGKKILKNICLEIPKGETHVIFGPNGSGKSTLMLTIMGYPKYKITSGKIIFQNQDITNLPINVRAHLGIGTLFQNPPTVKGVRLAQLLKKISKSEPIQEELFKKLKVDSFINRDLNEGLSGGEKKRSELLQILAQRPDFVMLDEPESGVDIENMKVIGQILRKFIDGQKISERQRSSLIITHTGYILDYLHSDRGHIILDGTLQCSGNPRLMFEEIQKSGFQGCELCRQ